MRNQQVGEDGPEDGRSKGAAHGAKERYAGCRSAKMTVINGVLYCNHQYLHYQSKAHTQHKHIISPPPPSPCKARKTINSAMFWLIPHSAEPTRKITIVAW